MDFCPLLHDWSEDRIAGDAAISSPPFALSSRNLLLGMSLTENLSTFMAYDIKLQNHEDSDYTGIAGILKDNCNRL